MVLRRTWVGGVALGVALWVSGGSAAHAQSADLATRRLLIEQGQQASQAGDHALAVQRAEAAMAIQETPSLRLFYARELVLVQRPADAFAQAEACVREVDRDASVPNREALLLGCRTISQETRGAIGMLTVTVRGDRPSGVSITVGGRPLAEALIGVPAAVNPGRVVVDGRAAGYRDTHREVDVARGGSESIALEFEVDPHAVTGRGAQGAGQGAGGGDDGAAPRELFRTRPVSIGAVVVTAVGGAALASAGLFYALRQGGFGACTVVNGSAQCPSNTDAMTLSDNAGRIELMNTLTNVALIGGTVVLAGGVAWLVADRVTSRERVPTSAGRPRAPSVALSVDGRGASVVVGGAF